MPADSVRDEFGNTVPLRTYIERILDEKEKALQLAFRAQQEALALASRTLELRLEKLNELRQEVAQDRGNYVTKDKYEVAHTDLQRRIEGIESIAAANAAAGARTLWLAGIAVSLVVVAVNVVAIAIFHK